MSDLVQRLRGAGLSLPALREAGLSGNVCDEAADRIEADEALLRQALATLDLCNMHGWFLADHESTITACIAALRERLRETR